LPVVVGASVPLVHHWRSCIGRHERDARAHIYRPFTRSGAAVAGGVLRLR